jgi:hypothetical protein
VRLGSGTSGTLGPQRSHRRVDGLTVDEVGVSAVNLAARGQVIHDQPLQVVALGDATCMKNSSFPETFYKAGTSGGSHMAFTKASTSSRRCGCNCTVTNACTGRPTEMTDARPHFHRSEMLIVHDTFRREFALIPRLSPHCRVAAPPGASLLRPAGADSWPAQSILVPAGQHRSN